MNKNIKLLIFSLLLPLWSISQNVNIPNLNFKYELVMNTSINTNADNEIQISEANVYSGTIDVSFKNINDLTGIEYFINLENLDCSHNQLLNLNISNNINLKDCSCGNNMLTTLNVSNNLMLENLSCNDNQISILNVSSNSQLKGLNCDYNNISILNIDNNSLLTGLVCSENNIALLNLSNNPQISLLRVGGNNLSNLNVSNLLNLSDLVCTSNKLTNLNLSNNNNLSSMNCKGNDSLFCIQVANVSYAVSNTQWLKDPISGYSLNCGNTPSLINDNKSNSINFIAYPNPFNNFFIVENSLLKLNDIKYEVFDIYGKIILSTFSNNIEFFNFKNGVYFIKITLDEKINYLKVIKN